MVTMSRGIATVHLASALANGWQNTALRADTALYQAKAIGRNAAVEAAGASVSVAA
jgi:PleD family two-component response regulator